MLLAVSLALAFGLALPPAHAGTYTDTYTDTNTASTVTPAAAATSSSPTDATATAAVTPRSPDGIPTYTIQVSPGTFTDTFTWTHGKNPDGTTQTDADDPPPSCVLVEQDSSATWYVRNENGTGTGSGKTDCGLPPQATVTNGTYGQPGFPSLAQSAVLYSVKTSPGASFSESCSPTASFTGTTGTNGLVSGEAEVSGGASVSPITISLGGTQVVSGVQYGLTGQQITATLNGIPTNYTVTKYTWSGQSATCFKTYNNLATSNPLVPLATADYSGPASGSTGVASFAFYDSAGENLTITCAVTVLAPDGTTLNLTVTAPTITVEKPTASWKAYTSGPFVNNSGTYGANELWNPVTITVPAPFNVGSGGLGCFAQLITPSRQVTRFFPAGIPMVYAATYYDKVPDGKGGWTLPSYGLDTALPYQAGYVANPDGSPGTPVNGSSYTWNAIGGTGISGDMPTAVYNPPAVSGDMGGTNWYTATMTDSFTTWLMYQPPGGVWVPLQKLTWSTNITVSNTSGFWTVSSGSTVTTPASGQNANDPPNWTSVNNISGTQMRP